MTQLTTIATDSLKQIKVELLINKTHLSGCNEVDKTLIVVQATSDDGHVFNYLKNYLLPSLDMSALNFEKPRTLLDFSALLISLINSRDR